MKIYLKSYLDETTIANIYNFENNELKIILNDRFLYVRRKILNSKKVKIFDKAIKNFIFQELGSVCSQYVHTDLEMTNSLKSQFCNASHCEYNSIHIL